MNAAGTLLVLACLVVARPAPAAPEYLVGVYYFAGWWRQQPNKWVVDGKDWRKDWPARVPLLGEYNEQETMNREIAAAADHGVDFFQILWYPAGRTPKEWSAHPLNAGRRQFLATVGRGGIATSLLGGGVMQQAGLIDRVRREAQSLINGYLQTDRITHDIDQLIVLPGLENRSGVLGAIALAATVARMTHSVE